MGSQRQPNLSPSNHPHSSAVSAIKQPHRQHAEILSQSPHTTSTPGCISLRCAPANTCSTAKMKPSSTSSSQQNGDRKRAAAELSAGETPWTKRQTIAPPADNGVVRDPLLVWAVAAEARVQQLAISEGKFMTPDQRRERLIAIYRSGQVHQRVNLEKKRQEQFRQLQIERKRQQEEEEQRAWEATEQQRVAEAREKDRLSNLARRQAYARAREEAAQRWASHYAAEQRKFDRAAATAEKKRREQIRLAAASEQERLAFDRFRAAQEQRRATRKAELERDPNRNFHAYLETLEYWPLPSGERQNQYLRGLLANQRVPLSQDSDLAVAIRYAKKHWYYYRQWPRDVELTAREARVTEENFKRDRVADEGQSIGL